METAEAVFATEGTEVHVETIAERAGLAVGTLYRHFPTKQALCEAVLLERLSALVSDAQRLTEDDDPGGAFFGFLEHFAAEAAAKRDLVAMMGEGSGFKETETGIELADTVGILLRRAQSVGAVVPGVSAATVLWLVTAASQAAAHTDADPRGLITIICNGLRPQSP